METMDQVGVRQAREQSSWSSQDVLVAVDPDEGRRYAQRYRTTRWARIRAAGPARFLWSYGILGFGIPLALFKIFADYYAVGRLSVSGTLLSAALALLGGILIGYLTWSFSERRFCVKMRG
jgi:hypothetical protein